MSNMTLLSISADAKTVKGEKYGYLTGILYMAPHTIGGWGNVCPMAGECKTPCLYTAGQAGVYPSIQQARIARKKLWFHDRDTYMDLLRRDMDRLIRKAEKFTLTPAVRLNGTSDIFGAEYRKLMYEYKDVQFYDYTKVAKRLYAPKPKNYHITFSRDERNHLDTMLALESGHNVAVVFNTKKGKELPTEWMGFPVIDGDLSDLRFLDPKGVVVGLRAKGQALKDTTGFVVHL